MADTYETVTQKPQVEDFTPLDQHQEQTPQSFFAAKPVLHLQSPRATVAISKEDAEKNADFGHLGSREEEEAESISFKNIDVWVTSRYLVLWSTAAEKGLRIPYPTITIHAQEGQAVLLELNLSDANTADEDLDFIQLRIFPTSTSGGSEAPAAPANAGVNGHGDAAPVKVLYDAISACQELNPDPNPEGDDDEEGGVGAFDETAPGATGWITSENMADFMDEDGNFKMPEGVTVIGGGDDAAEEEEADGLGAGAGRRRAANEVDAEDGAAQDETKWQRTG
ncbi:hypothetical protein KC349_g1865 [Hortaea werneckii]|nr:hypothetical protein KC349_g1865 [Hortaea werneckii]